MRDNALASALLRMGHQVTLIPLYTPMKTDTPSASSGRVFFGGINIYLQHASRLFRRTPRFLDWLFDRNWMLNLAANYGTSTPVSELGGLTLDLLLGEEGTAVKEVRRLADFIRDDIRPDIVTLPNLMFMGAARLFGHELNIPVICELTGEDIFLDALTPADQSRARQVIRERIPAISRFVATSHYYADQMAAYLGVARAEIDVVYPGLAREFMDAVAATTPRKETRPPTVGYLARICPEKGIERLVDAMILLRQMDGMADVQLRCAGYLGKRDQAFFAKLQERIDQSALKGGFTYLGEVDQAGKIDLLSSIDVFSAPSVYPESKGIYVLEAMAMGIPVVQPAHGSFPELIQATGGGWLTAPGDAPALAAALADALGDKPRRDMQGQAARAVVQNQFTDTHMAEQMLQIYQKALA
jgi:glycosyltransferase involved in cell wall biosynthesis